ncbi:hypothetical protein HZH68_016485 [Vespula germanica]|uniref:Uncharacterized protein n=1 Tax=Vespula germanica TaxID=30212 RepID=A0A834J2Z9_VESGE|nr:hypothetical protein HZH68_016485 [Vespula germanica]
MEVDEEKVKKDDDEEEEEEEGTTGTTTTTTLAGNRVDDDDDGSGGVGGGGGGGGGVADGRDGDDFIGDDGGIGGTDSSTRLKFVRLPTRDSYGAGRTVAPLHGKTLKPGRWNARVTTPPPSSPSPLLSLFDHEDTERATSGDGAHRVSGIGSIGDFNGLIGKKGSRHRRFTRS